MCSAPPDTQDSNHDSNKGESDINCNNIITSNVPNNVEGTTGNTKLEHKNSIGSSSTKIESNSKVELVNLPTNPAFVFSHFHHQEDPNIRIRTLMTEINSQVALFRDLLIHMGTSRDCPEMREKIRKLRRNCVDACKHTSQLLLPSLRADSSDVDNKTATDLSHNPHLVILYFMCQLFLRELAKCSRLVQLIPMDMSGYFENRAGPSNLGNVISQILLCKQIAPDFNQEEIFSIAKDSEELNSILSEMQNVLPQQDNSNEKSSALNDELPSKWNRKRRRSSIYKNMGSFCCMCRPNYL